MWRSQENQQVYPARTDSATSANRRHAKPSSSSSAPMNFLKRLMPGQRRGRPMSGDGEAGLISHFEDLPEHIQAALINDPNAMQNLRSGNGKIKVIYDPQPMPSDDEDEQHIQAAVQASLRAASPPPSSVNPSITRFFVRGSLDYTNSIPDGFYACCGEFPEVADKGELPMLSQLLMCQQIIEGRDVILFDLTTDPALEDFKQHVIDGMPQVAGASLVNKVAWVVQLVAARLGGAVRDETLKALYTAHSADLQRRNAAVVIPVGQLSVGLSGHRAMLGKLALDWLNIRTCILPGDMSQAYILLVREPHNTFEVGIGGAAELEINITDSPGEIVRRITGRIAASTSSSIGGPGSPFGGGPGGMGPSAGLVSASPPSASVLRSVSPQLSVASVEGYSGGLVLPLHVAQIVPRGGLRESLNASALRLPGSVSATAAVSSQSDATNAYENIYSHRSGSSAHVVPSTGMYAEHTSHRIVAAGKSQDDLSVPTRGVDSTCFANDEANPFHGAAPLLFPAQPLRWPFSHPDLLGIAFRPSRGARRAASARHLSQSASAADNAVRTTPLVLGKSDSFLSNGSSVPLRLRVSEKAIIADGPLHLRRVQPVSPPGQAAAPRNSCYVGQPAPVSTKRLSNGFVSVFDGSVATGVPSDPLSARHLPERVSHSPVSVPHATSAAVRPDMASTPFDDDDSNGGPVAPAISSARASTRFSGLVSSVGGEDMPWWGGSSRASGPSHSSSRGASGTAKEALSPRASRLVSDAARPPLAPSIGGVSVDVDAASLRISGHEEEGLYSPWPVIAQLGGAIGDVEMTDLASQQPAANSGASKNAKEVPQLASVGGAFADMFSCRSPHRLSSSNPEADDSKRPVLAALGGAFADEDIHTSQDMPVGGVADAIGTQLPIMAELGGVFGGSDGSWRPSSSLTLTTLEHVPGHAFNHVYAANTCCRTSEASNRVEEEPLNEAHASYNGKAGFDVPCMTAFAGVFGDECADADDKGRAQVPVMELFGGAFEDDESADGEAVLPVSSVEAGPVLRRQDRGSDDEIDALQLGQPLAVGAKGSCGSFDGGLDNLNDPLLVGELTATFAPRSHDDGQPAAKRECSKCTSLPQRQQELPEVHAFLHRKVDSVVSEPADLGSPDPGSPSQTPGAMLHPPTSPAAAAMATAISNATGGAADSSSLAISRVLSATSSMHSAGLGDQSGSMVIPGGGLRSLLENQPTQMMEKLFHMWIRAADITMTQEVIGRGSYGQVMLAKFRTERCAVKQIICETKAEYRASMQEMLLMQELQFDKIVRFFGAIKHNPQCLWICMEYMPFSDLRKILHSPKHRSYCRFPESLLTLARRLKWAKDVVAALDLLHSRCVVHRDLKPGNILISNKYDAVLSDFGLSRVRAAQQSRLQASGPGTVSYAAPEALSKNQVSPASDMFSFGCVLWELLSMKEPWAELSGNAFQVMSKIIYEKEHLQIEDIPTEVRDRVPGVIEVLELCFSYEPALRPAAELVYDVLAAAIELL